MAGLAEALETGGTFHDVDGSDKESVLRAVVERMRLPTDVDRNFLFSVLLAREALGSTAVGDGIAIPHVRNPIVLNVSKPTITLCFLKTPIDFGALDHKPVHALVLDGQPEHSYPSAPAGAARLRAEERGVQEAHRSQGRLR